jgi:hypothetical protein
LELLAQALNASSNQKSAQEAWNRAVRAADSAKSLTKVLADYQFRKNALKLTYFAFIADSLTLLRGYKIDSQAAREMKEAGHTPESLKSVTDQNIYEWQARWRELFLDSVQLLAMAQLELRATQIAMQQFEEKMKAMSSGGNLGRIACYRIQQDRQWEEFDRMTKPGTGSPKAVENPEGFARDQVDLLEKAADLLGENCELVMSDEAYQPAAMARLGSR